MNVAQIGSLNNIKNLYIIYYIYIIMDLGNDQVVRKRVAQEDEHLEGKLKGVAQEATPCENLNNSGDEDSLDDGSGKKLETEDPRRKKISNLHL